MLSLKPTVQRELKKYKFDIKRIKRIISVQQFILPVDWSDLGIKETKCDGVVLRLCKQQNYDLEAK